MVYLLYVLSILMGAIQSVMIKKYQLSNIDKRRKDGIYFFLTVVVAILYYAIQAGFELEINLITALYSFLYAIAAVLLVSVNMRALESADMLTVSLFSSAGGLVWDSIFGVLIFSELFTIYKAIALVMIFASVLIPYISAKKDKTGKRGIIYCIALFLMSGYGTLVLKLYSQAEGVMKNSVFCFYTNVFMIPFVLYLFGKNGSIRREIKVIKDIDKWLIALVVGAVVIGNVATLVNMYVISKIDLIVFSVLGKAVGLIMTCLFGRIAFGEKITVQKMICILLCVMAVAMTVI